MEQALLGLLGGDMTTDVLLMLFILGLLTKRFVPWWVYEDMVEKLREYEEVAPSLIDAVERLIEDREQSDTRTVHQEKETLKHVVRNTRSAPTRRKRRI
jgi:hypothetical protein